MESGSAGSEEKVSENYPEAHPFRFSPAVGSPLRIGILLDTPKLSAFFARIIEDIQGSNFANLELLVFRKKAQPVVPESPSRSVIGTLKKRLLDPRLRKTAQSNCRSPGNAGCKSLKVLLCVSPPTMSKFQTCKTKLCRRLPGHHLYNRLDCRTRLER